MRPKKKILLVCATEITLSDLVTKLKVWGYAVEALSEYNLALERVREEAFDLAILVSDVDPRTWNLFTEIALDVQDIQVHRRSDVRVLDLVNTLPVEVAMGVSRIFANSDHFEYLRTAVRLSVMRKRGPHGPVRAEYLPSRRVA
jgi:hypothetical protein